MNKSLRNTLVTGVGAFFLAILLGSGSETTLTRISSLPVAFMLLMVIILVGIIFDIIGVAAAVAKEAPLHAKAAKKQLGAGEAIALVRNAERVASFCNDVVGDICGTLGGAVGAAIVLRLPFERGTAFDFWIPILMTAGVAAVTIGGKAWGKSLAINEAERIMFEVGRLAAWVEKATGLRVIKYPRKKGRNN